MPVAKLWTISSILFLSGCAALGRPDTDLCIVNAPMSQLRCYNLKTDYSEEGTLLHHAIGRTVPVNNISDLNKYTCTNPDGLANLKEYVKALRDQKRE